MQQRWISFYSGESAEFLRSNSNSIVVTIKAQNISKIEKLQLFPKLIPSKFIFHSATVEA